MFNDINLLERHCKLECNNYNKLCNNIYKFDVTKLAKHLFGTPHCGEIYIIRINFDSKIVFKIGITNDLYKRLCQYRCGTINEPALMYYFPCKDILSADSIIKIN
jgi:hypothetical protein